METPKPTAEQRMTALATFLEVDVESIYESAQANLFEASLGRTEEYLVLTEEEADEQAAMAIKDQLWAFNAEFIASHARVDLNPRAIEALKKMQGELCEDAGPLVEAMIDDMDDFVTDAIRADGRGHFLANYDNEEAEEKTPAGRVYIYRVN